MKATFVLTPAEARRLIAKAVIQTTEFQRAWKDAYVLLAGGTTNAFIAQELGYEVEPGLCTVGSSTDGLLCVTEPSSRKSFPNVFYKGQPVDKKIDEALQDYHADTVIIKGANCRYPGCKYNGKELPAWMKKRALKSKPRRQQKSPCMCEIHLQGG